jgi:hypothetical protein
MTDLIFSVGETRIMATVEGLLRFAWGNAPGRRRRIKRGQLWLFPPPARRAPPGGVCMSGARACDVAGLRIITGEDDFEVHTRKRRRRGGSRCE